MSLTFVSGCLECCLALELLNPAGAKQAAEKLQFHAILRVNFPQGLKPSAHSVGFVSGLKPRPTVSCFLNRVFPQPVKPAVSWAFWHD